MSTKVILSGHDADLLSHVRSRLAAMCEGMDVTIQDVASAACTSGDLLIALDAAAGGTPAPPARVRYVDWSLLGGAWARTRAEHVALSTARTALDTLLTPRIDVLLALLRVPAGPVAVEFHASLRVRDLPQSVAFYAWLLNAWPREWTHRYATFVRPELGLNLVLMVADGNTLHHDTLYHLGIALPDRAAVIDTYHRARSFGAEVVKPPRTTWRGTPLHELWLEDPDGTLIEIYARLAPGELAEMPADQAPLFLVPGTTP
ncbi:MAG: VOC family protein [Gammaproteobacteria bacterium]